MQLKTCTYFDNNEQRQVKNAVSKNLPLCEHTDSINKSIFNFSFIGLKKKTSSSCRLISDSFQNIKFNKKRGLVQYRKSSVWL